MTRAEKWLVAINIFLLLLLSAFVVEHILLVLDYTRHSPQLCDECPRSPTKGG